MNNKIGITERGDAALNTIWLDWVKASQPAILISKDPSKLFNILKDLKNPSIIVHCTITGFGGTILEPNVPSPHISLQGYNKLIDLLGLERIVLRIDPIIPTQKGIQAAKNTIEAGKLITKNNPKMRIRISFLDNYNHVKERFKKAEVPILPWDFHAPLDVRLKVWEELGKPEVCGEPDMECTGCISALDCKILGVQEIQSDFKQRKSCACLANKTELLNNRNRCDHKCLYCYYGKYD